jgi:serpin B
MIVRFSLVFLLTAIFASAAEMKTAATATNQLGLDLLPQVGAPADNALLSPYSIQLALAMTYAGADGDTRAEMSRVLHFPADGAALDASFAALAKALDEGVTNANQQRVNRDQLELHVANRLFGQQGYAFRAPFLATLKTSYGAPFEEVDIHSDPENVRVHINEWVEAQTAKKIRDLIPDGMLMDDVRLVLANAVYFKAPWANPFNKAATVDLPFKVRGNAPKNLPTMRHYRSLPYAKHAGFTALALNYVGNDLQFLILLPDAPDGLAALEKNITPELFSRCTNMGTELVVLELPKFKLAPTILPLSQTLQTLGLKIAFNQPKGSANFDRIAPRNPSDAIFIGELFHKTFIALDEDGTEAAAAIAQASAGGSAPQEPIVVKVDHPFLFAIQHRGSGACLFLGRVTDPR